MQKRFISIWLRRLKTDWFTRRQPELHHIPFVLAWPDHGRMIVTAANALAEAQGISIGIAVADARAIIPSLRVMDDKPEAIDKLLKGIAEWCIRFTPVAAIDPPDGLILEATGCAHLWGGEDAYITEISKRIAGFGYHLRICLADTIGAAWAHARFGKASSIIETGSQENSLLILPPASLRAESGTLARLEKLGLRRVGDFIHMPRPSLRRRFGQHLLDRLDEATGRREEFPEPIHNPELYEDRLPCIEPIATARGIEIALERLLENICKRLQKDQKGLRKVISKGYRLDGKVETIIIGTNRPSCNKKHLFDLFCLKLDSFGPALGIELFTMHAPEVEDLSTRQEQLWEMQPGLHHHDLSELLNRIAVKHMTCTINRYVPDEHYWPERSFKPAAGIMDKLPHSWKAGRPRPLQLLPDPVLVEVTAPIPDYPPMMFRYLGKLHKIIKADGPERIEQEWWLQQGRHRDYYCVEDEEGCRYWLFRSGHYDTARTYQWFLHGFFA